MYQKFSQSDVVGTYISLDEEARGMCIKNRA